ncbi:MAG: GPR endopeptidase, partial [Clostridia bacterium]|nr:GPR endopeptidase [Clostridia bacterium]
MNIRTDLAADISEQHPGETKGVLKKQETRGDITISTVQILSKEGERAYGKPIGTYITVEFPQLYQIADTGDLKAAIRQALTELFPKKREVLLVAGLGNTEITADSIGPHTAAHLLATRHIAGQFAKSVGLEKLKSVSVITPGVLGRTGIEATELIKGAADAVEPDAVLVIDALASSSVSRLFKTVQLCDSGISPGSGVKNSRKE